MNTLNDLIRRVAKEHPNDDPKQLAKRVVTQTPPEELDGYYFDLLADRCSNVTGQKRNHDMSAVFGGRAAPTPRASKAKAEAAATKTKGKPPVSARLKAQRRWAAMMEGKAYVGNGEWKPLGECTRADLQYCIKKRLDNIAALDGRIVQYRKLDKVMEDRELQKVKEIKPEWFEEAA